jgi:hypothetical protein
MPEYVGSVTHPLEFSGASCHSLRVCTRLAGCWPSKYCISQIQATVLTFVEELLLSAHSEGC